ncbi:MAG TPA: DUF1840 domain-containing protein [Paenalcaligenes sp.]|nr:DUF1840 domain-containing protein [Paenalcaligenes sp.]
MLVVFESKAAARILMLGQHARTVLQAAGKLGPGQELPERGVFTAEQLAEAIGHLEAALSEDEGYQPQDDDDDKPHPISEKVSLTQRAYPLLEMLRAAEKMQTNVMWSPEDKGW